jgi:hypothetical protein
MGNILLWHAISRPQFCGCLIRRCSSGLFSVSGFTADNRPHTEHIGQNRSIMLCVRMHVPNLHYTWWFPPVCVCRICGLTFLAAAQAQWWTSCGSAGTRTRISVLTWTRWCGSWRPSTQARAVAWYQKARPAGACVSSEPVVLRTNPVQPSSPCLYHTSRYCSSDSGYQMAPSLCWLQISWWQSLWLVDTRYKFYSDVNTSAESIIQRVSANSWLHSLNGLFVEITWCAIEDELGRTGCMPVKRYVMFRSTVVSNTCTAMHDTRLPLLGNWFICDWLIIFLIK